MRIAIPTYKRVDIFYENTAAYLTACGVDLSTVDLFLSNDEEVSTYREVYGKSGMNFINCEAKTLTEKWNAIHEHYEPGTEVVVMEDDIKCLVKKAGAKSENYYGLLDVCKTGFENLRGRKKGLWGIVAHTNGFYMQERINVGLRFCVAQLFGFVSNRKPHLRIRCSSKTDYERTLRYFVEYNGVVRFDYIGVKTNNYKTPGGMQDAKDQRFDMEEESCDYLCKKFPHLCFPNQKKQSIYPELRLKTIKPQEVEGNDWKALQAIYDKQSNLL